MKMAEAMQKHNRVIHHSTLSARFISLFYGEIESTGDILEMIYQTIFAFGKQAKRQDDVAAVVIKKWVSSFTNLAAPPGRDCCRT
jgi:hypothetical protein